MFYENRVLPILENLCLECHEPGDSKGEVEFLDTYKAHEIQLNRGEWRSVAAQLMNRTMPPPDKPQPSEEERMEVVSWIEDYLARTACELGPYAGYVTSRRLNRLEYDLTVRDLLGVNLAFSERLPMESGGGEGFDNNGETLFVQPMLMERFVEAAQEIVDAVIVSPRLDLKFEGKGLIGQPERVEPGQDVSVYFPAYLAMNYRVEVRVKALGDATGEIAYSIGLDERKVKHIAFPAETARELTVDRSIDPTLERGTHVVTVTAKPGSAPFRVKRIRVQKGEEEPSDEQVEAHRRLLGTEPGDRPEDPRAAAWQALERLLPRAFRRPVASAELGKYLSLYDRATERGDPWEEAVKLALKGILLSPDFLFRIEEAPAGKGIQAIGDFELASRLSYFLWSTMPDEELLDLAARGKLNDDAVLASQVERMVRDERFLTFSRTFVGQWLGTKDVGGRVAPITNELQDTYTVEIASDMREEPVRFFHHLITENRPITELIDSDYTFTTKRLAKFLEMKEADQAKGNEFERVVFEQDRRGGVLGMASVLALTSHYKETSPVLRGAWVFDTLIGSPVPPPPPDVPPLKDGKKDGRKLTEREKLEKHREHTSCMACHQLIDPIGFGLQNFDFLGRWREQEEKQKIDATGTMPDGRAFSGPAEMRRVLVETRQPDFLRHVSKKMLSYALGRGIEDRDDCTIADLVGELERNELRAGELVKGIVLSVPFRNRQLVESEIEEKGMEQ